MLRTAILVSHFLFLVRSQYLPVDYEPDLVAPKNLRMGQEFDLEGCTNITEAFVQEVRSYREVVQRIFEVTQGNGFFAGKTYRDLAHFVDTFGSRLTGSPELEQAIDFLVQEMTLMGLSDVHTETVTVPRWQRGDEQAEMTFPRKKALEIITLGNSVPTGIDGVEANVTVTDNWKTLIGGETNDLQGKILLYVGNASYYSLFGASLAAKHGAVACLIRSHAPMSLNTPHANIQFYEPRGEKIPVGAISPEDADLIGRLLKISSHVTVFLRIEILSDDTSESRNVVGDYVGKNPDEIVLLSGHSDSWDVGQGAVDDGVGAVLSLEVPKLFRYLNLTPRRTVRTVAYTGEEVGLYGAQAWMTKHQKDLSRYVAALESDYGCFKAMGYVFTGKPEVGCVLNEIRQVIEPIGKANLSMITKTAFMPTDVGLLGARGVAAVMLNGNDGRYLWYHHTEADVVTAMDSKDLDTCLGVWAATTYILADLKEPFPK